MAVISDGTDLLNDVVTDADIGEGPPWRDSLGGRAAEVSPGGNADITIGHTNGDYTNGGNEGQIREDSIGHNGTVGVSGGDGVGVSGGDGVGVSGGDGVGVEPIKTVYIGHSGYTHHKRMLEHSRALNNGKGLGSAVAKHHQINHRGQLPDYRSKVLCTEGKNLVRLVLEALYMEKNRWNVLMNQRGEFGRMKLPRITLGDIWGQGD